MDNTPRWTFSADRAFQELVDITYHLNGVRYHYCYYQPQSIGRLILDAAHQDSPIAVNLYQLEYDAWP